MTENISSHSIYYDIDGNSILDIIDWEDGLEEGTGYETYLTWFRWTGKEYREYKSTNVVRNLNSFLEQARLYLSFKQMNEFLSYSLNLIDYNKIIQSKDSYSDWIQVANLIKMNLLIVGKLNQLPFLKFLKIHFLLLGTLLKYVILM